MLIEQPAIEPKASPFFEIASTQSLAWYLEKYGLEMGDTNYVRWTKTNPRHPRNWSSWRKTYDFGLHIFLDFFTTVISTAGTSASKQARHDLGIGRSFSLFSFDTTYMLAQAIGGVFFPPYSETFGRKRLFIIATISYCVSSIVITRVTSVAAIIIFRFISGMASALPTIVIAGSAEDIFNTGHRIWMIYAWAVAANVGICMGPILGTFVTDSLGWRWIFYISAIITGLWSILLLFIKESRPSKLLMKAVANVREESGDNTLRIRNPDHAPDFRTFAQVTLVRPVKLFFTEPIVFICSVLSAVAFGLLYLFTEALPIMYESYGFTPSLASLSFVPLAIGIFSGTLTRFYDLRIYKRRLQRGQELEPEDKLTGFAIGAPLLAIGLWWFAWTIPPQVQYVPWIVSMLSLLLVGYAANEFDCTLAGYIADSYTVFAASAFASIAFLRALCCAGYIADSYTVFAASAFASIAFLRALCCAGFPLFAGRMFAAITPNKATSILAALATVFCIGPVILARCGKGVREVSSLAKYSLEQYRHNDVDRDVISNDGLY
ncbi:hypothetical protein NHQ30_008139 [Ciborinia camelliae]|nr:hypothetical protein NHQ30_008139 [Ciborinia camelliae]